jgi:signal transduction histidine kinase/DNA-binding response OmpR family regulator
LNSTFGGLTQEPAERADILIVDDMPEKLLVFETVLEELGQNIVSVRSGSDALREILRREFAVILLDVNMPDIDGFETASLIRRYKRSAHTPIIFITSYADEVQTVRGYSLGAVDYILSPVVPEVLRSKVKVFVDLHLMQRRLRVQADERVALAQAEAARVAAEEATQRSGFLSHASSVLGGSLDLEVGARRLIELVVPGLADRATVVLPGETDDHTQVFRSAGSPAEVSVCPMTTLEPDERDAIARSMAERRVVQVAREAEGPGWGPPAAAVPLLIGQKVLGTLWIDPVRDAANPLHWGTLEDLAGRAAIAFENARLYRTLKVEIEERRAAETKLQESNRRKDEFLAMLSHELRNPLAPIRNALEVIRRVAPPDPKLSWATDVTGRQVKHLTRLVEELLDVARISQGKIALQTEVLDLRTVISMALETARPVLESRSHRVMHRVPDHPVLLRGDAARLAQVVSNLLHNAAKYTESGGDVSVVLDVTSGLASITVTDTGIGIEPDLLPNVFDLFEQGKRSLDRSQGGLGVGLTLVQRLVRLHKGDVSVTSRGAGQGSTFRVVLPCLSEVVTGPAEVDASPAEGAAAIACRVLVVDDNRDAASTTAMCLEIAGHQVRTVHDGLQALALAPTFAPDVVVLDIGLPGLDGYAVAARLRALPQTAGSLMIAVTGYGREAERQQALDAGFDAHLVKPAEPVRLAELIARWRESAAGGAGRAAPFTA